MAVKSSYKIPASLDETHLNMEIALQNKEGLGFKPLPVRVILVWLAGLLTLVYCCMSSNGIMSQAGTFMKILFAAVWILFLYLMTQVDKSHQMQIELIPALMSYMSKSNRNVFTRRSNNAAPFYGIVGIDSIDEDSGVVKYMDGTYGYWYSVVGSASVLLFPEDRDAVLLKVDDFYKKMQPDCEILFVTTKEPQRIVRQQAHLVAQYKALAYADPDIDKIVKEQYNVLTNFVGKEFKSLHQYMILKGDTREALSVANNIVLGECENSSLVIKECTPLYRKDIERVLKTIYAEGE
jgi:hypothetical protein